MSVDGDGGDPPCDIDGDVGDRPTRRKSSAKRGRAEAHIDPQMSGVEYVVFVSSHTSRAVGKREGFRSSVFEDISKDGQFFLGAMAVFSEVLAPAFLGQVECEGDVLARARRHVRTEPIAYVTYTALAVIHMNSENACSGVASTALRQAKAEIFCRMGS